MEPAEPPPGHRTQRRRDRKESAADAGKSLLLPTDIQHHPEKRHDRAAHAGQRDMHTHVGRQRMLIGEVVVAELPGKRSAAARDTEYEPADTE